MRGNDLRILVASAAAICALALSTTQAQSKDPEAVGSESFAYGCEISSESTGPLIRLTLPGHLYTGITSADLADIRVVDSTGRQLPFDLSHEVASSSAVSEAVQLQFFPIEPSADSSPDSRREAPSVEIEERANGGITTVKYRGMQPPTAGNEVSYLVDTRTISGPLSKIEFAWEALGPNTIVKVNIDASDDLRDWRPLSVTGSLAKLAHEGVELTENTVNISLTKAKFLRVRMPAAAAVVLKGLKGTVDSIHNTEPAMTWQDVVGEVDPKMPADFVFDTAGCFPVGRVQVLLTAPNSAIEYTLSSRSDPSQPYTVRHRGRAYRFSLEGNEVRSPDVEVSAAPDRYWQLRVSGRDARLHEAPTLRLGYTPHHLRFAASGFAPYQLLYGSRSVKAADFGFTSLDQVLPGGASLKAAEGTCGPRQVMAGDGALAPPAKSPEPINWKTVLLWLVLVSVVGLIGTMAYRLYSDMNRGGTGPQQG